MTVTTILEEPFKHNLWPNLRVHDQSGVVCPEIDSWAFADDMGLIINGDQ